MSDRGAGLYFVAALTRTGNGARHAHCLIRVNTPLGAPHVACVGRALGERWLDLMSVTRQACLVAEDDLTTAISFDVERYGVLVFEDDAALDAYLVDADGFDYGSRIRRPRLAVASEEPW